MIIFSRRRRDTLLLYYFMERKRGRADREGGEGRRVINVTVIRDNLVLGSPSAPRYQSDTGPRPMYIHAST